MTLETIIIAVADVLIFVFTSGVFLILIIRETTWSAVQWILSDLVENKEALLHNCRCNATYGGLTGIRTAIRQALKRVKSAELPVHTMTTVEALRTQVDSLQWEVNRLDAENLKLRSQSEEAGARVDLEAELEQSKQDVAGLTEQLRAYKRMAEELESGRRQLMQNIEQREPNLAQRAKPARVQRKNTNESWKRH